MNNILEVFSELKKFIHDMWRVVFTLSHFVGKVLVTALFLSASTILIHFISKTLGCPQIFLEFYDSAKSIYIDPVAWAATSIVIATTVAIGHMKNLEINEIKIGIDQEEQWEKKRKRREEQKRKSTDKLNRQLI